MTKKTDVINLRITPEKKALWQEYVDTMPKGFTLSNLIEMATDDKVAARVEPRDKQAGSNMHWAIKPFGEWKAEYETETLVLSRKEIARKQAVNARRAALLDGEL